MQSSRFHSGVFCIASSVFALALLGLVVLLERICGADHLSPVLLFFGGLCLGAASLGWVLALLFYVPLCLRVWRDPSRSNWRLWAVGTVLLFAAGGSVLRYT